MEDFEQRRYRFETQKIPGSTTFSFAEVPASDDSLSSVALASTASGSESNETRSIQRLIKRLGLIPHVEGGYFVETDRDLLQVPNPFLLQDQGHPQPAPSNQWQQPEEEPNGHDSTRSASTSIHYLLTPDSPKGHFHRNKGRTVHTLHQGRGRYVIIHADEVKKGEKARIETFIVGHNIENGEKLQWVVEGGKYKASFLLPADEDTVTSEKLLISETVVPGFEYRDHNFMTADTLKGLVSDEQYDELHWLLLPPLAIQQIASTLAVSLGT
ncbi:hypothetical protein MMC07_008670 [Pseudocyphellaria aurata]|nr:hypothetical protein [Pseudocyphellaria aurata]